MLKPWICDDCFEQCFTLFHSVLERKRHISFNILRKCGHFSLLRLAQKDWAAAYLYVVMDNASIVAMQHCSENSKLFPRTLPA